MKKKWRNYEGSLLHLPKKIYLKVDFLEEGKYEIKIVHKGKIIKTILFNKKIR